MRALIATLFSALIGLSLATNTTIRYYDTKEGCVGNYFQCSNIPIGYCCKASSPWCIHVLCPDCVANGVKTYSLLTHANGDCSGDPIQPACVNTSDKNNLCCSVDYQGKTDVCSTMVTTDVGKKQEGEGDGCLGVVQPDTLFYTDDGGATHEVHLPNGTFDLAVEFANANDWNGLANVLGQPTI
ncbi:hypothetical protein VPNG_03085 [Cytospora leucostoma]|uniref:Uncharacterized protein n=1 Tax=Cytospora leucostoma TaxID=1230097 RepID=A0A423XGA1_9PEZI|nr:hypothetical protein VPNG_03085 [Cytospora leucostoma]